jgi:serine phosphatase RsbU (regulator of sigma subunit)
MRSSDLAEITLIGQGDILFLYTDGVYDGTGEQELKAIERIVQEHKRESPKIICNAILDHAVRNDDYLRRSGESDCIDDKTAFIIKSS